MLAVRPFRLGYDVMCCIKDNFGTSSTSQHTSMHSKLLLRPSYHAYWYEELKISPPPKPILVPDSEHKNLLNFIRFDCRTIH